MKKHKINLIPYLFIAPTLILLIIFSYYAMADALATSFTDASIAFKSTFIGLENYGKLIHDSVFWHSFRNQAVITVMALFSQPSEASASAYRS
jgi:ABC-type sugar transport system permease subunit